MVEESEQSKVRRAWQVAITQAREADGDDVKFFFGLDVGSATILAVDAELTLLREVGNAARTYTQPGGMTWPNRRRLFEAVAALDKAKEAERG